MSKAKLKVILPAVGAVLVTGGVLAAVGISNHGKKTGTAEDSAQSAQVTTQVDADGNTVITTVEADGTTRVETVDAEGNVIDTVEMASHAGGTVNTGNLSATGSGYEGTKGTGKYNYGEALQKSLLFYELQRSGDLPEQTRCNWRGDSCLTDGSDNNVDLSGGWYDAGDNVKFNLPMSYSSTLLAYSLYKDPEVYQESGQKEYILGDIRWACEYFIKCHPADEVYYYQVGDGNADHTWWGPAELVDVATARPSFKVTKDAPGSAVCGETAAALASAAIVFEKEDPAFATKCLEHAISLYRFAENTKSDAGYTAANGFYNSWSGFYDELSWAGAWIYLATGEETYLKKAEDYYSQAGQDYDWALCWDDVHIGAALLLSEITEKSTYTDAVEKHIDWWSAYNASDHITYTPQGLAWLDSWGSLRYASTAAFVASVYADLPVCDAARSKAYWDFAESQVNYILGDTGFCYQIGMGKDYPHNPHHRTAQGSYCNNMNEPAEARHTLYGALVGGPDASDGYIDTVSNYNTNEVACDYNAGYTGALARMYSRYKGETLKDFGAVETPGKELYVEGGINVEGQDFIELKAYVYNMTAWPARIPDNLELRYYVDLSEIYAAGGTAEGIEITTNYVQGATAQGLKCWDEENHIYYLSITFDDNSLYPGGQEHYKHEVQARLRNAGGVWDNTNDPSFVNMQNGSVSDQTGMALYTGETLVYGIEPPSGDGKGNVITLVPGANDGAGAQPGQGSAGGSPVGSKTATNENVSVTVNYDNMGSTASSISGTMTIKNESDGTLKLSDLGIEFYFTKDSDQGLNFACYHAAVNGADGSYTGVNGCKGVFATAKGEDTDQKCTITFTDGIVVPEKGTITVNFCINHADWSNFTTSNDYSVQDAEHIVITSGGKIIFGKRP
ncbi:MAG: glycoside hydrolase family 9 protein [Lachnospiraceae bacterium]|nr:glycoside hydrolase family 9 protein [Lachnospiraceae bacterium]